MNINFNVGFMAPGFAGIPDMIQQNSSMFNTSMDSCINMIDSISQNALNAMQYNSSGNSVWQQNTPVDNTQFNPQFQNFYNSNVLQQQPDTSLNNNNSAINPDTGLSSRFTAEINAAAAKYKYDPNTLINAIAINSKKYNLDPNLLWAVIRKESQGNPNAGSGAGARGLMQLMPGTAASLGVIDPCNIEQSVAGGAKYIADMLKRYKGDLRLALAAYNAGPGNVDKYKGIPPFGETQNYVQDIIGSLM